MYKKISIITINYNNLEGLKRTVESVVNQTWQEFEYIVIDGGSTDDSATYIESQNAHFDYWVSEPDKGIYNAMNKGIAKANGEYLLFLNSGDHLYNENVLEESHSRLMGYDLIYFDMQIVNNKASVIYSYPSKIKFSFMYGGSLPHPATFIKATLFKKFGFYDENYKIVSDWKFFLLALFKYNCSYNKVGKTLSTFHLDGISSICDYSKERENVLKQEFTGFIDDYKELSEKSPIFKTNRFKMLCEIEKTTFGKKIFSFFFRIFIVMFSNKKLKDVLK